MIGLLIVTFLSSNVFAGSLNPTVYLNLGDKASFSGYLVEAERLQKSIQAIQELEIQKKLNTANEAYYQEKLKNVELQSKLELQAKTSESDAAEKALKKELAKREVFYRQPWFVASAVILSIVLLKIPLGY